MDFRTPPENDHEAKAFVNFIAYVETWDPKRHSNAAMIKMCAHRFSDFIEEQDVMTFLSNNNLSHQAEEVLSQWRQKEHASTQEESTHNHMIFFNQLASIYEAGVTTYQREATHVVTELPAEAPNDLHWNAIDKLSKIIESRLA